MRAAGVRSRGRGMGMGMRGARGKPFAGAANPAAAYAAMQNYYEAYGAYEGYGYDDSAYGYEDGYGGASMDQYGSGTDAANYAAAMLVAQAPNPTGGAGGRGMFSSHTSSRDPNSMRARVFVGNLNTKMISREQLARIFARFGRIVGLSMHKGFAFVQYSNETEARSSVSFTDQMQVAGQVIDVNLSCEPKAHQSALSKSGAALASVGTGAASWEPAAKRTRMVQESIAAGLQYYPNTPDTLICGRCQTSFTDVDMFVAHRSEPCASAKLADTDAPMEELKDPEPESLSCFICQQTFANAWMLVEHLDKKHNKTVYLKDDKE